MAIPRPATCQSLKLKNIKFFRDVISLLAQVYIVSVDRAYKEVSTKKY